MRKSVARKLRYLALAAVAVTATAVAVPSFADSAKEEDCSAVARNGFAHLHASGMWSMGLKADHGNGFDKGMSVSQERARLSKHAKDYRDGASIVTHTEAGKDAHWKTIRQDAGPCWSSYPSKSAEETVEWDTRRWKDEKTDRKKLVKVSNRTITATVVRLKEREAPQGRDPKQVIMIVSHLPAHVEDDWDKNTARVKQHKKAMGALQNLVQARVELFPKASIIVTGDWNLNHKKKYRYAINRHLEGDDYNIRPAWTSENTGHSLYGSNRLIDADWYTNVKRCGAYVKDIKKNKAASDHIPFRVRYSLSGSNC